MIDGPSSDITGLSGLAAARDGTGGLVYLKNVGGAAHVFLSRLLGGRFQPPQQVDAGLSGPSSQPVIAAANPGLLLIAFINDGTLYTGQAANGLSALDPPSRLMSGASSPSLSLSPFGKGYLAFTAVGNGGNDIRAAYYSRGQWALAQAPLDAVPSEDAGTGTGRPDVATAGDGVGIVVWGENGHVYSRRIRGTAPSISYEQADPASVGGVGEVSADQPVVATGGDSSYAAVAFRESLTGAGSPQSRVLVNRLHGFRYDGIAAADGVAGPGSEGAGQPQVAVTEYGAGFVTSEHDQTRELFAAPLAANESFTVSERIDSQPNSFAPDAVPAAAGVVSTLVAWQQSPGASGPADVRVRYAPNGYDLGPEQVISSPGLGAVAADQGLFAAGDIAGDAVVAWVQGSGATTQIVAGQLYQTPGGFGPASAFHYSTSANPVLAWSTASELWGPAQYTVALDGAPIATTTATSIATPTPVSQGRHTYQVTATNLAGLKTSARSASVFVDSVAPRVSFTITGIRSVKSPLHVYVTYTDSPPPLTPEQASGISTVQVRWGDGAEDFVGHEKYHLYGHPGAFTVTVIVNDLAGNQTAVTRTLTIHPKPKPKPKKPRKRLRKGGSR